MMIVFVIGGLVGRATGDVVVTKDRKEYVGVIERRTTDSVHLFDGNLRRIIGLGDIDRVIQERPDTSWLLIGDRMVEQRDWEAAYRAYQSALEQTNQPEVIQGRLERLRAYRFQVEGSELGQEYLEAGNFREAIPALHEAVKNSQSVGQQRQWRRQLAKAYVGLAEQSGTLKREASPFLVYALFVAPDSAAGHALLAERLEARGHAEPARQESLLAADLDPGDPRARARMAFAKSGASRADSEDPSGLRAVVDALPDLEPGDEAPLTEEAAAKAIQAALEAPGAPARVLTAAYLLDAEAALVYRGELPYPVFKGVVGKILRAADEQQGETEFDKMILAAAIKHRIDPRFIRAIAKVRTSMVPARTTVNGATGLVPLTRRQWEQAARLAKVDWRFEDASDPEKSVSLAVAYLDWLARDVLKPYFGERLAKLERIRAN